MDTIVDARGKSCPQPVICTKRALESLDAGVLTTIVDNDIARDNVIRLAKSLDYPVDVEQKEEGYYIKIKKEIDMARSLDTVQGAVILVTSATMGRGSDELGRILTKSFFFTLTETLPLPRAVLFINGGVKLTCEGSHVLEEVISLEKKGVEILSCGTCLDFFRLKEKLCAGSVTNMCNIVEKMMTVKSITV
ncbi:MAG: sulfurtransferase-like selenium metabolism protein YedF [Bacillota bacterium]